MHYKFYRQLIIPTAVSITLATSPRAFAQAPSRSVAEVTSSSALSRTQANVSAALVAVFAAAEKGDLAALDTLYAGDSLTVIEGAGINRTWTDYRDHHLGPELKEMHELRYRPTDIEVHVVSPTTAWAIFRYALTADVAGTHADVVGRGTAVLERQGTRWVIRHTQTSGRARRPSDPAPY